MKCRNCGHNKFEAKIKYSYAVMSMPISKGKMNWSALSLDDGISEDEWIECRKCNAIVTNKKDVEKLLRNQ